MTNEDVKAIVRGITPVLREKFDEHAARVEKDAAQAEAVRQAEHRALMAEGRAMLAALARDAETPVPPRSRGIIGRLVG